MHATTRITVKLNVDGEPTIFDATACAVTAGAIAADRAAPLWFLGIVELSLAECGCDEDRE